MLAVAIIAGSISSTSCSKQPAGGGNSGAVNETMLSRKTEYGNDWIYFSLSQGKEVDVKEEDHYESTEWDLAFNRYNVRTNSGKSGKGQGGAARTDYTEFSQCKEVPEDAQFVTDDTYTITAPGTGFPPPTMESTANELLSNAIRFAGPPPTYTPEENVYIVRAADGAMYRFKALSFYDKEGNSGYYTFSYEKMQ